MPHFFNLFLLLLSLLTCDAGQLGGEYRSVDGSGNNANHPDWGAVGAAYLRYPWYRPRYGADNNSVVIGLPNARVISNAINAISLKQLNTRLLNDMHTTWGHFIDHDLTSASAGSNEAVPIPIPPCDPDFDPDCTGNASIPFTRSRGALRDGARQQFNDITSLLDGANIYGNDPVRAAALRTFDGGKLRTNVAGEPPLLSTTAPLFVENPVQRNASRLRLTGDSRNNVSPMMLSLQSVFIRDHNRYCDVLRAANPTWSDETLYQESRRRVVAHIQRITYTEYLPALLGFPLPLYAGYNASVDPTVANFFGACAFRYGHPEVNSVVMRLTSDWVSTLGGPLLLRDVYFNPEKGLSEGIEPLLRGMLYSGMWQVEVEYNNDLRNHLFENPGKVRPMDLLALDIQRGRDHGLPGYNDARAAYGLPRRSSFEDVSSRPGVATALRQLYATVDDIDSIVGGLAEDAVYGNLGELLGTAIQEQFQRTRSGDRFWYENGQFDAAELQTIHDTTLVAIINRNTNLSYPYDHAFFRQDAVLAGLSTTMPYLPALGAQYSNLKELDRGYRLYWEVDIRQAEVRFAVQAHGQGWVGLGFAQYNVKQPLHSYMYHVDMVLGRLAGGVPVVDDRFSFELGQPSRDVDLGCSDDLSAASLEVYDTYRVMRFARPFVTPDSQQARGRLRDGADAVKMAEVVRCDTPLVAGADYYIIYAANPTQDVLAYHGVARGAGRAVLIAPLMPSAASSSGSALPLALSIGVGMGITSVVLVGITLCCIWRITAHNRALRKKFSNDNVAESCAEAIARFDLAAVAWLQEVKEPNKIQKAFLAIVTLLTEVKPYIPDQLLCRLVVGDSKDTPDDLSRETSKVTLLEEELPPDTHPQPGRALSIAVTSLTSPSKQHRPSVATTLRSGRAKLTLFPSQSVLPITDGMNSLQNMKDWVHQRCTYMCIRFGSTHPHVGRLPELVRAAGRIVDIAKANGATIDAVGVDFISVHWGVSPRSSPNATKAIQVGLAIGRVRETLPEDQRAAFWLQMGVGKGLCDCGTVSSESGHRFFVVWGSEPSLAACIATNDIPKRVQASLLVSPTVYQEVQFTVQCMPRLWHGDALLWEPLCLLHKEEGNEWMYQLHQMGRGQGSGPTSHAMAEVFLMVRHATVPMEEAAAHITQLRAQHGGALSPQDLASLDLLLASRAPAQPGDHPSRRLTGPQ